MKLLTRVVVTVTLSATPTALFAQECGSPVGGSGSCSPCTADARSGCGGVVEVAFHPLVTTFFVPYGALDVYCSFATTTNSSTGHAAFSSVGDCTCNESPGPVPQYDKTCSDDYSATLYGNHTVVASTNLLTLPLDAAWTFAPVNPGCTRASGDASLGSACALCPPPFFASTIAHFDSSTQSADFNLAYGRTISSGQLYCPPDATPYLRHSSGIEEVSLGSSLRRCTSYTYNAQNGGGVATVRVWFAAEWQKTPDACVSPSVPSPITTFVLRKRVRLSLSDGSALASVVSGTVTSLSGGAFIRTGIFSDTAFEPTLSYSPESELVGVSINGVADAVLDTGILPVGVYITSVCETLLPSEQPVLLDVDRSETVNACDRRALYSLIGATDVPECETSPTVYREEYDYNGDGIIDASDVATYIAAYNMLDACTRADYNCDGVTNPDDLGDYVTDFYSSNPADVLRAEFNDDGVTNPDDVGDFITVYYTCLP